MMHGQWIEVQRPRGPLGVIGECLQRSFAPSAATGSDLERLLQRLANVPAPREAFRQ